MPASKPPAVAGTRADGGRSGALDSRAEEVTIELIGQKL